MTQLKTTWYHIRRSPYQAVAAVFILMQTFFVISLFAVLGMGSVKIIAYLETLPQIQVFFKNEAKQKAIDELKQKLQDTGKIARVQFISKQEAFKIYNEQFKNDPILLELVSVDTLPSSFKISTNDIRDLSLIASILKSYTIVDKTIYQKDIIDRLTTWTDALKKIGLGLSIIFILDSIFLIMIIISIKISQKKKDIEIMRLIGATKWYISLPFIVEGIVYGIVGTCIGWILSIITLLYYRPFFASFLGEIPLPSFNVIFFAQLLGIELLASLLLGAIAAYFATVRYFR